MPYPDPLTPNKIQIAMQSVTLKAYGINPPFNTGNYSLVRVGWQTQGQPAQAIGDNVAYLRTAEEQDEYNSIRDVQLLPNDATTVLQLTTYTRIWRVFWTIYGPDSFDRARTLKSRLYEQDSHDELANLNLYMVMDPSTPQRVPEFKDGQWWERVDFNARFNEAVSETLVMQSVASTEIILENADGVIEDFTVEA